MKILKVFVLLSSTLALSGCLTSGGGGTGGGSGSGSGSGSSGGSGSTGGSATAYDTAYTNIINTAATQSAITGTANYSGQMAVLVNGSSNTAPRLTNDDNTILGDLTMTVDFNGGANPIDATATNFAGMSNGTAVTLNGSLTTAEYLNNGGSLNSVDVTGAGPITLTNISANLEGTLTDATGTSGLAGDVRAGILGGVVRGSGSDPEAIAGAASVFVDPTTGTSFTLPGSFYVNKQ